MTSQHPPVLGIWSRTLRCNKCWPHAKSEGRGSTLRDSKIPGCNRLSTQIPRSDEERRDRRPRLSRRWAIVAPRSGISLHLSALPGLLLGRAASQPLLEPRVGGHVSALPELLLVRAASPPLLEPRGDA